MEAQGQPASCNPLHMTGTPGRENANKVGGINGDDPDGIEGVTEEFIVHLARDVKEAQQVEKCCYHCDSPDHFIHDCPH